MMSLRMFDPGMLRDIAQDFDGLSVEIVGAIRARLIDGVHIESRFETDYLLHEADGRTEVYTIDGPHWNGSTGWYDLEPAWMNDEADDPSAEVPVDPLAMDFLAA